MQPYLSEQLVERVAKTLFEGPTPGTDWWTISGEVVRGLWRVKARKILAALFADCEVVEEWVVLTHIPEADGWADQTLETVSVRGGDETWARLVLAKPLPADYPAGTTQTAGRRVTVVFPVEAVRLAGGNVTQQEEMKR